MPTMSAGQAGGLWFGASRVLAGLGRAARLAFGLVLVAAAVTMGLLLGAALLLRAAFSRGPAAQPTDGAAWGDAGWPRRAATRRPTGEVVDIVAREVGPGRQ